MSGWVTNCLCSVECSKLVWHTRDLWAISAPIRYCCCEGEKNICVSVLVLFHVDLIQSCVVITITFINFSRTTKLLQSWPPVWVAAALFIIIALKRTLVLIWLNNTHFCSFCMIWIKHDATCDRWETFCYNQTVALTLSAVLIWCIFIVVFCVHMRTFDLFNYVLESWIFYCTFACLLCWILIMYTLCVL